MFQVMRQTITQAQTGTNDLGQDVAYLYHIGDLRQELKF